MPQPQLLAYMAASHQLHSWRHMEQDGDHSTQHKCGQCNVLYSVHSPVVETLSCPSLSKDFKCENMVSSSILKKNVKFMPEVSMTAIAELVRRSVGHISWE